ncbi:hypothetical protein BGX33_005748 [Mortierella sp. NVP41]|nr:hypothetical protein BGX33_005748 [Mortierella sp. NVP41]
MTQHILQLYDNAAVNDGRDEAWLYTIFAKYGHHIRRLKTKWGIILMAASAEGACQNLQSFTAGAIYHFQTLVQITAETTFNAAGKPPGTHFGSTTSVFGSSQSIFGSPQPVPNTSQQPVFGSSQSTIGSSPPSIVVPESVEPQFTLVSPILEGVFDSRSSNFFGSGGRSPARIERQWIAQQHLWLLILQNPHLKTLISEDRGIIPSLAFANPEFFYRTLGGLKDLMELDIGLHWASPERLLDVIPSLRTLSTFEKMDFNRAMAEGKTWSNIRAFKTAFYLRKVELLQLLKCFPNLEDLTAKCNFESSPSPFGFGGSTQQYTGQEIGHGFDYGYGTNKAETWLNVESILGTTPTRLRRLCLTLSNDCQKLVPSLIPWCLHLTEVILPKLDLRIATALAVHCPSLQVFRRNDERMSAFELPALDVMPLVNVANILFSNCRHLRVFDAIQHTIEIDRLRDQPWVCPNLEILRCQFVGFERLDADEQPLIERTLRSPELVVRDLSALHQKCERSKSQHQLFFATLADLQNLRILDLGQYHIDIDYTPLSFSPHDAAHHVQLVPDSPSLTLFYGLDRLRTLTKLECLNFEGVDHRMDVEEITWMATHWSSLKWVRGLQTVFKQSGYKWDADHRRTFLRDPLQRLRSDVRQEPDSGAAFRGSGLPEPTVFFD